jgi:hemin uptake protein HemP
MAGAVIAVEVHCVLQFSPNFPAHFVSVRKLQFVVDSCILFIENGNHSQQRAAKMNLSSSKATRVIVPPISLPSADQPPSIDSRQLFFQHRLVQIEHAGQHYQLRLTRENKLILTK